MTSSAIVHENKFNNFQSRFSPKWGTLFSDQNYFLLVCPIWQDKILLQELTDFLRKLYACVVIVGVYWVLYHDQRKRIFLLLVSSHTAFYYFSNAFFFVYTILLLYRGSIHLTKCAKFTYLIICRHLASITLHILILILSRYYTMNVTLTCSISSPDSVCTSKGIQSHALCHS